MFTGGLALSSFIHPKRVLFIGVCALSYYGFLRKNHVAFFAERIAAAQDKNTKMALRVGKSDRRSCESSVVYVGISKEAPLDLSDRAFKTDPAASAFVAAPHYVSSAECSDRARAEAMRLFSAYTHLLTAGLVPEWIDLHTDDVVALNHLSAFSLGKQGGAVFSSDCPAATTTTATTTTTTTTTATTTTTRVGLRDSIEAMIKDQFPGSLALDWRIYSIRTAVVAAGGGEVEDDGQLPCALTFAGHITVGSTSRTDSLFRAVPVRVTGVLRRERYQIDGVENDLLYRISQVHWSTDSQVGAWLRASKMRAAESGK